MISRSVAIAASSADDGVDGAPDSGRGSFVAVRVEKLEREHSAFRLRACPAGGDRRCGQAPVHVIALPLSTTHVSTVMKHAV
jgi:hypothetical protein